MIDVRFFEKRTCTLPFWSVWHSEGSGVRLLFEGSNGHEAQMAPSPAANRVRHSRREGQSEIFWLFPIGSSAARGGLAAAYGSSDFHTGYSMNSICHSRFLLLTAVLCCIISFGCGSADEARDAHHDDHHGQEHDDHEQLEHFVPAHKPKDFEQLVEQLAVRFSQLSSASATNASDKSATTALQELADIIGWIPELAADSELRRSDFESAVAAANKLANVFNETAASADAKPVAAAGFEPMIEQLRQLVPKSQSQAQTEQK